METTQQHCHRSVAAQIGSGWIIDLSDAARANTLCVDWALQFIYTEYKPDRTPSDKERNGHISVYRIPGKSFIVMPDYFLRLIESSAREIARIAHGYSTEQDGCSNVARFQHDPDNLFTDMNTIRGYHAEEYMSMPAERWLSGDSLTDLKGQYGTSDLHDLARMIALSVWRDRYVIDHQDLMTNLARLRDEEAKSRTI